MLDRRATLSLPPKGKPTGPAVAAAPPRPTVVATPAPEEKPGAVLKTFNERIDLVERGLSQAMTGRKVTILTVGWDAAPFAATILATGKYNFLVELPGGQQRVVAKTALVYIDLIEPVSPAEWWSIASPEKGVI